jgi:hypothetical protein
MATAWQQKFNSGLLIDDYFSRFFVVRLKLFCSALFFVSDRVITNADGVRQISKRLEGDRRPDQKRCGLDLSALREALSKSR